MSINTFALANKAKQTKKTSSGVITFLAGVLVGTVIGSLVVVNYYAGSVSQPRLVLEQQDYQHLLLQQRQPQHQQQRLQQHQHQQLRIERSSTSTSNTVEAGDNLARSFNIVSPNKSGKTLLQLTHQQQEKEYSKQIVSSASSSQVEPSFFELARQTGTDKVKGVAYLPSCLEDDSTCTRPSCEREKCRPWGHFYHTMYQQKLSKYLNSDEDFLLVEIGYVSFLSFLSSHFYLTHFLNRYSFVFKNSCTIRTTFGLYFMTESRFWLRHI